MNDTAGSSRFFKAVPAPIPEELFVPGYTITTAGGTELVVYACRMDGCHVPDSGRELHRRWHADLAWMIRDAGAAAPEIAE